MTKVTTTVRSGFPAEEAVELLKQFSTEKVTFAETQHVDDIGLKPYIKKVLHTASSAINEPGIADAFVSDESILWDFGPFNTKETKFISQQLGFSAILSEYVWKIAKKLKEIEETKQEV